MAPITVQNISMMTFLEYDDTKLLGGTWDSFQDIMQC